MKTLLEEWREWPWETRILLPIWMSAALILLAIFPFGLWPTRFGWFLVYVYVGGFILNFAISTLRSFGDY